MIVPSSHDRLLQLTGRNLEALRWHLRFTPELEARFEQDTGPKRRQQLLLAGAAALTIYDLFPINDLFVRPLTLELAVLLRLGVMTPLGLVALWLIHRGVNARLREFLMSATVTVAVTLSSALFFVSDSPSNIFDPFAFCLIFVAANVAYPLRFVHALVTSSVNLLIIAAFVVPYQPMMVEAKFFVAAALIGCSVFTLMANFRLELSERRTYLLLLRERIRAEAALTNNEALVAISNTDSLTDLANRRSFEETFAAAWKAFMVSSESIALLMIDVDNFKRYNDRFGHPAGDRCLRDVARAMRQQVRDGDFIARVGGEEFAVILMQAHPNKPFAVAERIRKAVEQLQIAHDGIDGQDVVTVSIGIALSRPGLTDSPSALVTEADAALYEAKSRGRNTVYGVEM